MANNSPELITFNVFGEIRVTRQNVTVIASATTRKGDTFTEALYDFPEQEIGEVEQDKTASAVFAAYVKPNGEFLASFQETGDYHLAHPVGDLPQVAMAMSKTFKTLLKKATAS